METSSISNDRLNRNWLVAYFALMKKLKNGLEDFISKSIECFYFDLYKKVAGEVGHNTIDCAKQSLLNKQYNFLEHQDNLTECKKLNCPNVVCHTMVDHITMSHRSESPTWKNTDLSLWTVPSTSEASFEEASFEVAKCFVPYTSLQMKSFDTIDCYGLLCIMMNMAPIIDNTEQPMRGIFLTTKVRINTLYKLKASSFDFCLEQYKIA